MVKYPIVILHGWNLNAAKFTPLVEELRIRGYPTEAIDLPGFGKAKIPYKQLSLSDYVSYVKVYLNKHKIDKVILIGHSFGGRIGIKFTAQNPQIIKALILTGAPVYPLVPKVKILFFLTLAKLGNIIFSLPLLNIIKNKARLLLYQSAHATDFYNTNPSMRETFKNIVREDLVSYLSKIKTPTLLLWGKEDQIVPMSLAAKANKTLKNSQLVIIPDARHAVPWTHPAKFASEVERFLKRHE